jgi:transcriptional regulator with XRE-family HTH domain
MLQEYSGPKLKSLRRRARLTQTQVVELAGVSEATLCYLERGERRPQTRTLEKLLSLYAIRIEYWNKIDQVFTEKPNGGNLDSQATVGAGSARLNVGVASQKAAHERPVPVSHGLCRV